MLLYFHIFEENFFFTSQKSQPYLLSYLRNPTWISLGKSYHSSMKKITVWVFWMYWNGKENTNTLIETILATFEQKKFACIFCLHLLRFPIPGILLTTITSVNIHTIGKGSRFMRVIVHPPFFPWIFIWAKFSVSCPKDWISMERRLDWGWMDFIPGGKWLGWILSGWKLS